MAGKIEVGWGKRKRNPILNQVTAFDLVDPLRRVPPDYPGPTLREPLDCPSSPRVLALADADYY